MHPKSAVTVLDLFPNEFPEEAGWIREEKERDEEISSSREKTDRAERAVAINLARPPSPLAFYNHDALKS